MSKILFLMVVILSLIMMALKVSFSHFLDLFSYFRFVKMMCTDNSGETKITLKINIKYISILMFCGCQCHVTELVNVVSTYGKELQLATLLFFKISSIIIMNALC